jgi:PAS domain S-box-containing protein
MNVDRTTERYFELLEAVGQAVIATDAAGAIILWSPAAEALYGWKASEVLGRNILEITPMEISRSQGAEIMQVLGRGELWSGEFEVRTRRGKQFTASVTDVPLLSDTQGVAGVIGVSAASRTPTKLRPVLKRFAAACRKIWPKQIEFDVNLPAAASLAATEPHMIQLLALLVLLYADALDRGALLDVSAGTAERSPFADFGLTSTSSALYVRIDRRDAQPTYSVLRNLSFSAEPTRYASALVRMVGGMLIAGTAPDRLSAMHLFLPLEPR